MCPGVASAVSVQPGPATVAPSPIRRSGRKPASIPSPPPSAPAAASAAIAGERAPAGSPCASTGAPTRSAKARAPALWSRCAWVTSTAATRSPLSAAASAARWRGSSGPGSITATSPAPTM